MRFLTFIIVVVIIAIAVTLIQDRMRQPEIDNRVVYEPTIVGVPLPACEGYISLYSPCYIPKDAITGAQCPLNFSYTNYTGNATSWNWSFPASAREPLFNLTVCDEDAAKLGPNCTCFDCGYWTGYEIDGFYNHSGIYYSDGTPTGKIMKQMEDEEEMQSNIRYQQFMNEHGVHWNGKKWQ